MSESSHLERAPGAIASWQKPLHGGLAWFSTVAPGLALAGLLYWTALPYLRGESCSMALMGVFFSAGWSPCVGPVLGAILTFAVNGGSVSYGVALLSAYSLGLAIPFLLAALSVEWVTTLLRKYGRVMHYAEIAMGVVLVIVGVMLFAGTFELIARYGYFVDLGL